MSLSKYLTNIVAKYELLSVLGLVLTCIGFCGLIVAVISPFSFIGGLVYTSIGLILSFLYSQKFRVCVLSKMSPQVLELLYEKSLIEQLLEPSPFKKLYAVLALSFVAPRRELDVVIQALPQEYDRLRSPGLISLLPDPLRELLFHPSNRVPQTVINGAGDFLSVRENSNLFVLPNSFEHSAQTRGAIQTHYQDSNGGIGAFTDRQQFVRESTAEISFENVVQTVGTNALKRQITGHLENSLAFCKSSAYFICSGGNIPMEVLATTCATSTFSLIGLNRIAYRDNAPSRLLGMFLLPKTSLHKLRTLNLYVSLITGSMLIVRGLSSEEMYSLSNEINEKAEQCCSWFSEMWTTTFVSRGNNLLEAGYSTNGVQLSTHAQGSFRRAWYTWILRATSVASLLTVIIAWKMKSNSVGQFQWIYNIIMKAILNGRQKTRQCIERTFQTLTSFYNDGTIFHSKFTKY